MLSFDVSQSKKFFFLLPLLLLMSFLGTSMALKINLPPITHADEEVPEEFDARENWPDCDIGKNVQYESCPTPWAGSVIGMINARICITTKGKLKFEASYEELLTCCLSCYNGPVCSSKGFVNKAIQYWIEEGIPSGGQKNSKQGCKPVSNFVTNGMHGDFTCEKKCTNSDYKTSYDDDKSYGIGVGFMVRPFNLKHLQIEIMKNGPVVSMLSFASSWVSQGYKMSQEERVKPMIAPPTLSPLKRLSWAILVIGWGVHEGVPYWLCWNIAGEHWGDKGLIKIRRGDNDYFVETEIWVGYASNSTTTGKPKTQPNLEKLEDKGGKGENGVDGKNSEKEEKDKNEKGEKTETEGSNSNIEGIAGIATPQILLIYSMFLLCLLTYFY